VRLRRACSLPRHAPHDSAASYAPGISIRELQTYVMMLVPSKHIASELVECSLKVGARLGTTKPALGDARAFPHPQDTRVFPYFFSRQGR
jgi:hypothetical protein